MMVNRRSAIKQFLILTGGVVLLPRCVHKEEKASIPLKNIDLNSGQEKLLAEIAGTIIPATDTPGAKDVYAHLFALKMVDDCYDKDKQQQFADGLKEIDGLAERSYGSIFINCTIPQRASILTGIEAKKGISKNLIAFYNMMKNLTIQGYMTSKYVMTKLVIYELVPGRFHGTVPIT
jgi:hypothetical protein